MNPADDPHKRTQEHSAEHTHEPSVKKPLHQNIGFEVLAEHDRVKVSRFSRRIRLLHWFNAIAIISLYGLAIQSLVASISSSATLLPDLRSWHITLGLTWLVGVPVLWLLSQLQLRQKRATIASDQFIIKQRLFLYLSISLMLLMALTGSLLTLLRTLNMPELRSILLLLHAFIAFSYLPFLASHIYLAILQRESRQSLRTMISDVYIKYLIHNHIPNLHCGLTDQENILFIRGQVSEISLRGFHVIIEPGSWQNMIRLNQLTTVEFQHPELSTGLQLPVLVYSDCNKDNQLHINFNFNLTLQESAQYLLTKGLFFRALFLARRHHPRLSCHYPISILHNEQQRLAHVIDIGLGGMGIISPLNLLQGDKIKLSLQLKNPQTDLHIEALIVVKAHLKNQDFSYGLCFINLKRQQLKQLSIVLSHALNQQGLKNTHYWN